MNGLKAFITDDGLSDSIIATFLGMEQYVYKFNASTRKKVVEDIILEYNLSKEKVNSVQDNSILKNNLSLLAEKIGLSETEIRVYKFLILSSTSLVMENALNLTGRGSFILMVKKLSKLLSVNEIDTKEAISDDSILIKLGLLKTDKTSNYFFTRMIEIGNGYASSKLLEPIKSIGEIFVSIITKTEKPILTRDDFQHLHKEIDFVIDYLKSILKCNYGGGHNILIYGPPGTGKTEFAKLVAHYLDVDLYSVITKDEGDDQYNPYTRWKAFVTAQHLFRKNKSLILFDEIEDIFNVSANKSTYYLVTTSW